jgi:hypothetical protein
MNAALGVLWVLAIWASGHAVVRAWSSADPCRGIASLWRIGALVLLGAGVSSVGTGVVLLTVGARLDALASKDLLIVAASCLVLRRHRPSPTRAEPPPRDARPSWTWLLAATTAVVAAIWAAQSVRVPDADWDAWMIWTMRARFLARASDDVARAFAPSLAFSHTDYPLFVPGLVASAWRVLGSEPAWVPAVVSCALGLASLLVLVGSVAALRDERAAVVAGVTLLGAPFFTGQAAAQCADVPLSAFVCLSASLLAWAVTREEGRRARTWALAGTAASLAVWTKNEGLLAFVTGAAAVFLVRARQAAAEGLGERLRRTAWFVAGGLPVLLLVAWFKWAVAPENDLLAMSTSDGALRRALDPARYARIAEAMLLEPFRLGKWNALPVVLCGCAFAARARGSPAGAGPLGAWLGLLLAGFFTVYVLTPHDLGWHLVTSLDRLLVQVWPLGVLTAFLVMRQAQTEGRPRRLQAEGGDGPDH